MTSYTADFHRGLATPARASAEVVVPLVIDLVHPTTMIDVGCGTGSWASVFQRHGVEAWGVDGFVDDADLDIPSERFTLADLTRPLALGRSFDLALSLEVAEHLPASAARDFVVSLTSLAPVVLFSAAIPFQGGNHHVNEQWPEYWAALFADAGYAAVDAVRRRVWHEPNVAWWYAQNMLLFVRDDTMDQYPQLAADRAHTHAGNLAMVHPVKYNEVIEVNQLVAEIVDVIPSETRAVLVGVERYGDDFALARAVWPFLERDGKPFGNAADDETAIAELERLRAQGASVIAFTPMAHWWLDHYTGFASYLSSTYRRLAGGRHLIAFDLK